MSNQTWALLIGSLVANLYLGIEHHELKRALANIDNGYMRFAEVKIKGKRVADMIQPGTAGLFMVDNRTVVCAAVDSK